MELFVRRLMFLAFQFITFFFVLSSKIQDSLPYVNIETTNAVYARIFTDKSISSSLQKFGIADQKQLGLSLFFF